MLEARKVQRLGTSSLVVTLPKNWARKMGLKPGDTVYMVDDGNTLRIIPGKLVEGQHDAEREVQLTIQRSILDKIGVSVGQLIGCLYVLGYHDSQILGVTEPREIAEAKKAADTLSGVEVYYSDGRILVRNFSDVEKLEITDIVLSLESCFNEIIAVLQNIIEGKDSEEEVREALRETTLHVLRQIHIVNRRLLGTPPTLVRSARDVQPVLLALGLAGLAAKIMLGLVSVCASQPKHCRCNAAIPVITSLAEVTKEILFALALKKLHLVQQVRKRMHELSKQLEILRELTPYLAGRLESVIETLRVISHIALCTSMMDKIQSSVGRI